MLQSEFLVSDVSLSAASASATPERVVVCSSVTIRLIFIVLFLSLLGLGHPSVAQDMPRVQDIIAVQKPPADQDTSAVDAIVAEALASNLALQQEEISLDRARRALAEARGRYLPSLSLQARYSRAEGGRTIDFPAGDLINPVYRTLNDLTDGQAQFPEVENQTIQFLREEEQETQLQLRQPIYNPRIIHGIRARRSEIDAQEATVEGLRRELVRDVHTAFYRYQQAERRITILQAAREQAEEARRTTDRLVQADRATRDAAFRAEADVLDIRQQIEEAFAARNRARRYVNVLRNAPLNASLPVPEAPTEQHMEAEVQTLSGHLSSDTRPEPSTEAADTSAAASLRTQALSQRPELNRLDAAADAAVQRAKVARSAYLPEVSVAVDAGIQGKTYGFDSQQRFVLGSVVLRWNLFNGFQDGARVDQARLEAHRLRIQRRETARQIEQQVLDALERVRVAQRSLQTATARLKAAQESYRRAALRYDSGQVALVSLTDARTTLTSAELNRNVTRFDLLIRLAELRFAIGDES